ncbi:hypothetical protein BVC80_9099g33 [Macleaya cordata]|uniref:Uncharacterized protein n=1 Tax=Macleaya cordata TaxID=56857 RepID=A0A200PVP4_MACCD|nr:hypothetical protein BVC80_9099g33 [Macleaya cordata]
MGEFGYTRLFATKEKLTLTYIGNHDGEPHDMVEILSSGRVLKGVADSSNKVVVKSTFSWFVKGASILVLGAFMGYVIGFISHAKRVAASGTSWTPVKSDDV